MPRQLQPSFHEKVWGSPVVGPWFAPDGRKIGEVWFRQKQELPLLVKFIFTTEKLSVQVHPGGPTGKTEMWHVLRADPGASIAMGPKEPLTREDLREASLSGEIEGLLDCVQVQPGETYFMPAGTIHAIGGGLALCEIQQNCDITYRLYDYGRPRELHLNDALAVANLEPHDGRASDGKVDCEYFYTEPAAFDMPSKYEPDADRFHLLTLLDGHGVMAGQPFRGGQVWYVAPGEPPFEIKPRGRVKFLRTWVP